MPSERGLSNEFEAAREILTEIGNLKGGVGEIKGKLDSFITTQMKQGEEIKELRVRLVSLERTEARLYGITGILTVLLSLLTPFAVRLIFGG